MLVKTLRLRKNAILIKPSDFNYMDIPELVENIKLHISKEPCNDFILDLTELNLLDCIRVGVLSATYHFIKSISGKIYLMVQDREAKRSIDVLNLSNAEIIFNQDQLSLDNIA